MKLSALAGLGGFISAFINTPYAQAEISEGPTVWSEVEEDQNIKLMMFVVQNLKYDTPDGSKVYDTSNVITYQLYCAFGPKEFGVYGHAIKAITGVGDKEEPVSGFYYMKASTNTNGTTSAPPRMGSYNGKYVPSGKALGGYQGYVYFSDDVYEALNDAATEPEKYDEVSITFKGSKWERSMTFRPNKNQKAIDAKHKYCAQGK